MNFIHIQRNSSFRAEIHSVHPEQKSVQERKTVQSRSNKFIQTMQQTYIIYKVLRDEFYSTYIEHTYRGIVHLEQKFIQSIQSRS